MSDQEIAQRAGALYAARAERMPIVPFTDADPTLGMDDGYAIQREFTARLLADGDSVVGYKAGLTSAPMQELFGVDSPDFGPVLDSAVLPDGATICSGDFIAPKVEAEIVFRLGRPLTGPGVTVAQASAAVGEVLAGLEVVDSRFQHWRFGLADTIADLAGIGAAVFSRPVPHLPDLDYRLVGMAFSRDGVVTATGAGAAALGDPIAVIAWLANVLGERGITLEAGQLIMTGALHAAVPLDSGGTFTAEFDHLGSVTLHVDRT